MILVTPSLTHYDSYSYLQLLSLTQFKLLTHSRTFPLAQLLAHSLTDFFTCWIVWSFTRSSTHPPAELFVHSHWLVHLFICWIVSSFTYPLAELFSHLLTDSLTHPLIHLLNCFIHSFTHSLIHSFTCWIACSFTHWFIHSFTCWIIRSFTHSSTCSLAPHCDVPPILQSKDEHRQNLCLRNYAGCWRTKTVNPTWYQLS